MKCASLATMDFAEPSYIGCFFAALKCATISSAMEVGLGARNLDAQHQQSQEEDAEEWRRSHTAPTMAEESQETVAHLRAAKKHPM